MTRILFGFFVVFALLGAADAEQVLLVNGDRITGTVLESEAEVLVLETEYAGTLRIPAEQVLEVIAEPDAEEAHRTGEDAPATEDAEKAADSKRFEHWRGDINLGFHWESNGASKVDLRLDSQAIFEKDKHKLTLKGAYKYGESDGEIDTRGWKFSAYWQYYLRERLFTYTLLETERDDARKLELRAEGTLGLGYDAVKTERTLLSLGIGLGFTHEQWRPYSLTDKDTIKNSRRSAASVQTNALLGGLRDGSIAPSLAVTRDLLLGVATLRDPFWLDTKRTENFMSARATLVYEQKLFESSRLREAITVVPNLEDFGEIRVQSELSYTQPLSKSLQFRLRLLNEYDSESKDRGIKSVKSDLTASLGFVF